VSFEKNAIPLIAGTAGGLLLWALLRRRQAASFPESSSELSTLDYSQLVSAAPVPHERQARSSSRPSGDDWQWPVPLWRDYSPVISDGWGSSRRTLDGKPRTHQGVDIMYARRSIDDRADEYPNGSPGGSKWHFMPEGVPVLATRGGRVTFAKRTPRGLGVIIRHPDGWSTFYQHLAVMKVSRGDTVETGHVLGEVGGDPAKKHPLRHLHFEVRGRDNTPVDPRPLLRTWPRVELIPLDEGGHLEVLLSPPRRA
jgi:murein DD-endopeptidase MepM/ murein hydrolase activator NlpD